MSNTQTETTRSTPRPWKLNEHCKTMIWTEGDPYGHGQMRIADIRGWGHLTGQGACRFSEDKAAAIQDANAELIVRSVNSHQALIEALKGLVACCTDETGAISPEPHHRGLWLMAMVTARQALKDAEER